MPSNSTATRGVIWDVLAPIVRWPLHSPARLATVLALAILAGITAAQMSGGTPTTPPAPLSTTTTSTPSETDATSTSSACQTCTPAPAAATTTTLTLSTTAVNTTNPSQGAAAAAKAAEGFVAAWAQPKLPQPQWFAGVRDYLSSPLAEAMQYTTPSQVPAAKVTGQARPLQLTPSPNNPTSGTYVVPTDAGDMRVALTLSQGRWLVDSIEPASVVLPGD